MGVTAENVAERHGSTREAQDAFAAAVELLPCVGRDAGRRRESVHRNDRLGLHDHRDLGHEHEELQGLAKALGVPRRARPET